MKQIVIWAHGVCRSTMSFYREIKRQAGIPVIVALWQYGENDNTRKRREKSGQRIGEYDDLGLVPVGEDIERGRALLAKHNGEGIVHIFSGYQVSPVFRRLIKEAKDSGAFVVVYDEAPSEMCLGFKALMKRMYYKFVLPKMVVGVPQSTDLFLNASGMQGVERLQRLGWRSSQIVPLGYASAVSVVLNQETHETQEKVLRVLHTGVEVPYRGFATLEKAVAMLKRRRVQVELRHTEGKVSQEELRQFYKWADVFVACGLCEPWGMRVNDAIHAGLPVIVSSGMGSRLIVEETGCGVVYNADDVDDLAKVIARFKNEDGFLSECRFRVATASKKWSPEKKAQEALDLIRAKSSANC